MSGALGELRETQAWFSLELARWWRPWPALGLLLWLLLSGALAPRLSQEAKEALLLAGNHSAAAAAQRWGLVLLPVAAWIWIYVQRRSAASAAEADGLRAWPGANWPRALGRFAGAGLSLGLYLTVAVPLVGWDLMPLPKSLFEAEPKVAALFAPGETRRIPLPSAPGAERLTLRLKCLPLAGPEVDLELRLISPAGSELARESLRLAGTRRVDLPWSKLLDAQATHAEPSGARNAAAAASVEAGAGITLELTKLGGGAGLRFESPGLTWSGAALSGWRSALALATTSWLAGLLLLGLIEVLGAGLGPGLTLALALCAAWPLGAWLEAGWGSLALQLGALELGSAPDFPGASAWLAMAPFSALCVALSSALNRSRLSARELRP
jgi:hypothetical protein